MSALDDWSLLTRWRDGDARSGEALFERHFASISRFWRSKLPDRAQDMIQKTFLAAVEGRDRIESGASFKAYLFGIARRQLFRVLRDERGLTAGDFTTRSIADLGPSPATHLGRKREQRLMIETLRRIPLDLQIVLELYFWEELSAREIGEVLDVPEGTVRGRIRRARAAFAQAWSTLDGIHLPTTDADLRQWAARIREVIDADG